MSVRNEWIEQHWRSGLALDLCPMYMHSFVLSGGCGGNFFLEEGRCLQITGACDPLFSYLENISGKAQGI